MLFLKNQKHAERTVAHLCEVMVRRNITYMTEKKKKKSTKKVENTVALGLPIVQWPEYSPQKWRLTHFTLYAKVIHKIYRDREMGPPLLTIAPRDAINAIQPLQVYNNKKH
jgi:hypothetical protein